MPAEFEFQDLSDAVFWGVDLQRATFRDVDMSGARVSHARLHDVVIDAQIDRLVVNGVDVTDYVNQHDEWLDLRSRVTPSGVVDARASWPVFVAAWTDAIERVQRLPDELRHARVDGEWSFVETLRHLVFALDKWFTVAVLGGEFHPTGLPNSGSIDVGWPGLELDALPSFDEAVTAWRGRAMLLDERLRRFDPMEARVEVDVMENGPHTVRDCIGVVFEEHFQHLRYALRDLDRLA